MTSLSELQPYILVTNRRVSALQPADFVGARVVEMIEEKQEDRCD